MRRHCPSLVALQAFEAVATHGSLTRAAQSLHISQGAVSKQIKQLETFLTIELFQRQRYGLELTAAGQRYLQEIAPALSRIEAASLEAMAPPVKGGELRITCMPTLGAKWLIPKLPDFFQHWPEINLTFLPHRYGYDFSTPQVDASMRFGDGVWPDCQADYVVGRAIVPVAKPGVFSLPVASPEQLAALPLLQHVSAPHAWHDWMHAVAAHPKQLNTGPSFDQFSLLTEAAIAGLGVALIPACLIEEELRSGKLEQVYDMAILDRQGYYLCYPPDRAELPELQVFRAWLREQGLENQARMRLASMHHSPGLPAPE
ncbi:LysR family transcriptional regulator [Pollutimonas subterranea]|uniref:LysR family transcriptional regulator n=1 Tax=Pollutimonas subterranea TaxID=2045210 RepID=A0A2N4U1J2_9BURK|nr:LysR substrate-binding domain-containing protein [Pollutimonas subterranea]PLC48885.1 LysR family transcriptional regulator [Pollutimonas subterranea]